MIRTVNMLDGSNKRIKLKNPIWSGNRPISPGIWLRDIFVGKKSKRVVVCTNSIWENSLTHNVCGVSYDEVSEDTVYSMCKWCNELAEVVDSTQPAEEL